MKQWLRRLGCFLLVLIWLVIVSLPLLAVIVARSGQVRLGAQESAHVRLFLVQEEESNGLGIEWTRASRQAEGAGSCWRTSVSYWLWKGEGENVMYCQCVDAAGNFTHACSP
ncbi:MAG: hypothetical protein Fur0021_32170 [Candidatus Promineifilaceae bacterium]